MERISATAAARMFRLDPHTVARGRRELLSEGLHSDRILRRGARRKRVEKSPELLIALEKLMEFETAGDPMTELKWTRKTTEKLALQLTDCGFPLSPRTAGRLLYDKKYRLRVNAPCPF